MNATHDKNLMLFFIKLVHTLVWICFVFVIGFILYAGIFDVLDFRVALALGLIVLEGVVLKLNHGSCPLTPIAAKYTTNRDDSFDIFLPSWLAKHNKSIFGTISLVGAVIVVYRMLM